MELIKKRILEKVKFETPSDFVSVLEYKNLVRTELMEIVTNGISETKEIEIWTDAIQMALNENKRAYIPDFGKRIYLDDSVVLKTGYAIKADKNQEIALTPDTNVCLLRNENIISGVDCPVALENPDEDIYIEGGIWTSLEEENGNALLLSHKENPIKGVFSIMLFSNVRNITFKNIQFTESPSYAIQLCNVENFNISDIRFFSYHKDGIHLNGPARFGVIENLYGDDMGDDMVAVNAWDWHSSAMSFGTISNVYINNINSTNNEFRLLPGQKIFENGERVDCDIRDLVIENVRGVYTYKLYAQPYYLNELEGINDVSGTVGVIENVYFKNIEFPRILQYGFADIIAVKGLFEICADCDNIFIEDVLVCDSCDELLNKDVTLVKVGPLSATYKLDEKDTSKWCELFEPDAVCTVKNIYIKNVVMGGEKLTESDASRVARAIKLTVNENYPVTIPKGGNGYGILEKVHMDQ